MEKITVSGQTLLDIQMAWEAWTNPSHLIQWTFASPDWHSPSAKSDLKTGGRFLTRMEAKDGSAGFDFEGTFLRIEAPHLLEYRMDDGREVLVTFQTGENGTLVTETFDPENIQSPELQKNGWQAIMDNYVLYADSLV
jgi:uncharacterized protein YndB with AHSA1/START domain